jgi:hypothetical protein
MNCVINGVMNEAALGVQRNLPELARSNIMFAPVGWGHLYS